MNWRTFVRQSLQDQHLLNGPTWRNFGPTTILKYFEAAHAEILRQLRAAADDKRRQRAAMPTWKRALLFFWMSPVIVPTKVQVWHEMAQCLDGWADKNLELYASDAHDTVECFITNPRLVAESLRRRFS